MFKIHKIYSKRAMIECPKHTSKKGTADLDLTLEGEYAGYFRCWSCGYSGKITDQELEKIRSMRGEIKETEKVTDWFELNKKYIANCILTGVLSPLKVGKLTHAKLMWGWDGQAHTFPERNAEDQIIGILRRFPDRNKGVVSGSKRGIYIPRINFDSSKTLYITEGVSDLAVVRECGLQGIGRSNCNANAWDIGKWMELHGFKRATIIADNDASGLAGAADLSETLNLGFFLNEHSNTKVPPTSDLYDMFLEVGLEETKKWLTE